MNFDVVLHAVGSVFTLFLIGCVGYWLAKRGWFSAESKIMLPRLVTLVALPPYMLYNINTSFTRDELFHLAYGVIIPIISILSCFGLSLALARLLKVRAKRHGIFCASIATSNTIFIGLPVNVALFGEGSIPYVLLYYFANTGFFWTIGNYIIAAGGELPHNKLISKATFKQVFSPPLLGFLAGIALLLLGVKIPSFLGDACRYLGNMVTPLIVICIGITLQAVDLRKMRIDRDMAVILLGRFVISPLTVILLTALIPVPDMMRKVFVIQASLPVVVSVALLSTYYKSDGEFGALSVSLTTLLSVLTIPLYMIIISH